MYVGLLHSIETCNIKPTKSRIILGGAMHLQKASGLHLVRSYGMVQTCISSCYVFGKISKKPIIIANIAQ